MEEEGEFLAEEVVYFIEKAKSAFNKLACYFRNVLSLVVVADVEIEANTQVCPEKLTEVINISLGEKKTVFQHKPVCQLSIQILKSPETTRIQLCHLTFCLPDRLLCAKKEEMHN